MLDLERQQRADQEKNNKKNKKKENDKDKKKVEVLSQKINQLQKQVGPENWIISSRVST